MIFRIVLGNVQLVYDVEVVGDNDLRVSNHVDMIIDDQFFQVLSIFLKILDNHFAPSYFWAFNDILLPAWLTNGLLMPEQHLSDPNNHFLFIPGVVALILLINGILHNIDHANNSNILLLTSHTILMPGLKLMFDLWNHKPILTIDVQLLDGEYLG